MNDQNENETKQKVPLALRIFGWFLIIGGVIFVVTLVISGGSFSPERNAWNILSKSSAIVAGLGFLKMKKWAVYLRGI